MNTRRPGPHPRFLFLAVAAILGFVMGVPQDARAGGIARPNIVGARAVGMGGAYTAVADDALSIWHNPAGLARISTADILFGAELALILRSYNPPDAFDLDTATTISTPTQKAKMSPSPLPVVMGGARMLVGKNSFLALGLGVYNSFGGAVTFDKSKVNTEGVIRTQMGLFEIAPTLAYQVSDKIFVGASVRLGIGFLSALKSCGEFTVCAHDPPALPVFDTTVNTMIGAGAGYSFGIQVLPVKWLGLGLTYRSNLDVTPSGKDAVVSSGIKFDAKVKLPFPQSVAAGAFVRVHPRAIVAVQFDWVDNSRFRQIFLDVDQWAYGPAAVNTQLNMKDGYAAHLGTEIQVHKKIVVRAGLAYDSQSIPNRYRTRELADAHKMAWDLGATVKLGKWRIDFATELMLGDLAHGFKSSVFPNDWAAPGRHFAGGTFSLHLGGGVSW